MISLLLAILSSALISILMRVSTQHVTQKRSMLAVNYLTCLVISGLYTGGAELFSSHPALGQTFGLGAIHGVLYLTSFLLFQWCVGKNGVVLPAIFMKLGLLVPLAVSMLLFHEMPTPLQALGFCLAVGAIVLINLKKDGGGQKVGPGLVILLLAGGAGDAMSKVFEELGQAALSAQFLFYTFLTAFVLCVCLMLYQKERPGKAELLYGALIGIPNFFSARFLLGALKSLPAVIVYPTFSVATILVVTMVGLFAFRERLDHRQWTALSIILAALVLLNV